MKKFTPEEQQQKKLAYNKEYRAKNKEVLNNKQKINYSENKSIFAARSNKWQINNKQKVSNQRKKYWNDNKIWINEKRNLNQNIINKQTNEYCKKRKLLDPLFKLKSNIRSLIRNYINNAGYKKNTKSQVILGCSFEQLKHHLEAQFEPWMNWDNYGNPKDGIFELNKTWDIDHIIPIASAKCEVDILRLNHYTNLQPLCSYYNRWIKRNII